MKKFLYFLFVWIDCFLYYVIATLAAGTLLGAFLFLSVAYFTTSQEEWAHYCLKGMWAGFRYAGVWAGGLSLVLTVKEAYERRHSQCCSCTSEKSLKREGTV